MGKVRSANTQRRVFRAALPVIAVALVAEVLLLDPDLPEATRLAASTAGALIAGLTVICACVYRTVQTSGRRRRSWLLFSIATIVALLANGYAAAVGADPVHDPSHVSDAGIVLALLLSIAGLVTFPSVRRRGSDQVLLALDGIVAGGGVLVISAVLVYPELIDSGLDGRGGSATTLVFPLLDVVLATVALGLLMRATGLDRPVLILIASGFVAYAATDLTVAVLVAQGEFAYGSRLDVGWTAGYVLIGLAALVPSDIRDEPPARPAESDPRGAVLVVVVILVAGVVQVVWGDQFEGPTAVLWLGLVLAAGARQALLSRDNASLRRGLERRVAEQTADLRRLVRQNEVLLASVGDGIYGVDRRGRITFVNPATAQALGLSSDELLGSFAHDLFHGDHDDHGDPADEPGACYITRAVVGGDVVSGLEDTYSRSDGGSVPVDVTASPLLEEEDDEPRGAVIVFRDVTHRREVERMKNEFLSVVSHELRTPLTSIRGSLGLLGGGALGELGPQASTMVSVAVESSERLTRLINDLLDIERIGSGARALQVASHEAGKLVGAAVHQIEGLATPLGIHVEVGTCEGRVLADEDQVMQTLTNLLGNAIKFSEPGGRVVASARRDDGQVVFRVRDEGRGIPADKLEEVFEPFAQADSSDTREKGGTGLGLAISRSIIERHGGRIWAESVYGEGTTVSFTLPTTPDVRD